MQKSCRQCATKFEITDDDLKFYDKISPVFAGKKYLVPAPTLCVECRLQRRFSWRNDRNLYVRTCDFSGQKLISMFSQDKKIQVYQKDIWWSDKWDPRTYGKEFNFSQSFFDQFEKLNEQVPHAHVITINAINSLYTNYNADNKNCYLCFAGNYLEDSYYCYNAENSKNCVDCLFVYECELCYECVQTQNCYNTSFALHAKNCSDSFFIEDCSDCRNCFLCFNLQHKQYCILNQQYTKEEYNKILESYELHTVSGLSKAAKKYQEERFKYPKKVNHNLQVEDCSGEYLVQSKNCKNCYAMSKGCEDDRNIFNGFPNLKDALDCTYCGENATLIYESMGSGANIYHMAFNNVCCSNSSNLFYCNLMFMSKNCFGCSNMRNAEYCILNKQYTKEAYEKLVPKIIEQMGSRGEWGEFFPARISPFAYNETLAQDYFPLTNKETLKLGWQWKDEDILNHYQGPMVSVPENIRQLPNTLQQQIFCCNHCQKNYKIIGEELKFYKTKNIPLPKFCPNCRHKMRMLLRNPRQLYARICAKCAAPIQTTYAPERPEIVYCESCYLKEVY